jgi:uncharacterized membrane protein
MKKKLTNLLFIFIFFVGLLLRLYNLGKYDFWYDEIVSILTAKNIGLGNIVDYGYTSDSPLFCFLLSFWLHFGESEFILRLLPFIFGVLSIPAIYFIGKELFDKKVGLIAAFILAISPFHIYYSQELRTYTLVTFLVLMAIYHLVRSLKENKIYYWASFIVFTILALYSHNIVLFLIIALNLFFPLFYKRYKLPLRIWLIGQFLILLLYLPWLKIIFKQMSYIKVSNILQWVPNDHLSNFIYTFTIFNLGYNSKEIMYLLVTLMFLPLFLFAIWVESKKEQTYMLSCWLFIPIIITMVFSALIFPIYIVRALIYVSTAYYIIIAYGLSKLKPNKVYLCFLLLFSIVSGLSLENYYLNVFYPCNYDLRASFKFNKEIKPASNYIKQSYQKGDIVLHKSKFTYLPFLYYHNNRLEENLLPQDYIKKIFLIHSHFRKINITPLNLREIKESNYKRIWLVSFTGNDNQIAPSLKDIKDYLDRNYTMAECKKFVGIIIYLYQRKAL